MIECIAAIIGGDHIICALVAEFRGVLKLVEPKHTLLFQISLFKDKLSRGPDAITEKKLNIELESEKKLV